MSDDLYFFIVLAFVAIAVIAIFSALIRGQRYHKARQRVDVRNVADYGAPTRSLYTNTKVFSLHNRITITDERDQPQYLAHSKILSLHDKTWIDTPSGERVAYIWSKAISMHERHFVEMADGTKFQLSNELFHIVRDVTNIEELGWVLEGNIIGLNFVLRDAAHRPIAAVGQKVFSVHDRFSIDIYQPQYERIIVAIVVTLQHMLQDRRNAEAASEVAESSAV